MFLSKYAVARHIIIPVIKRGSVDFAVGADWTPASGDVKISLDGAAAANVTNLPVAITMGNTALWDFSLTVAEMTAAQVLVTVADAATKAVEDQAIVIETYGNASAQHRLDLGSATVNPGAGGIVAASFAADAIDANAVAAAAATEIAAAVWAATMSELSSVPAPNASTLAALEWLFTVARNRRTQTSSHEKVMKDDGSTVIGTSTTSDTGGTFTREKYV